MIIDTTQTAIDRQMDENFHPDCCECPKCLHELYNPPRVYRILRKTISGCVCSCGSVDFGVVAAGCQRLGEPYLMTICKDCNDWLYI